MTCFHPLQAFYSKDLNPTGKRSLVFRRDDAHPIANQYITKKIYYENKHYVVDNNPYCFQIPCGQCVGCRLKKSSDWAVRCVHESYCYDNNIFITLTYKPILDENGIDIYHNARLDKTHLQKFNKRLRRYLEYYPDLFKTQKCSYRDSFSYYGCGEYGDKNNRPHFHQLIFNLDFKDKIYYQTHNGNKYYRSPTLEKIWGKGMCVIGELNFKTSAYTARYCMKKLSKNDKNYKGEFAVMSRRVAIGRIFFNKYFKEIYRDDSIIIEKRHLKPPLYYDCLYRKLNEEHFLSLKTKRKEFAQLQSIKEQNPSHIYNKEFIKIQQITTLLRPL